jgi:putative ABC transport system permease protein
MLKNYIKIAFRNLLRYKVFSVINILGLAIGLACCMLISLYVKDELGYDKFHANADRIYRVTRNWVNQEGVVSLHLGHVAPPFGPLLENDFPDIEKVVRLLETNFPFRYEEKSFNEENVFIAEPAIFDIFTIPVVSGDPKRALNEPFSIMLSDKAAERYFGLEDPVGKTIRASNKFDLMVTGVFKSLPANAHFHPEFLLSFSTLNDDSVYGREALKTNFGNNSFATYLLLPPNYPADQLETQFPAFLDKHLAGDAAPGTRPSGFTHLFLQKLTDIHLHSNLASEIEPNGDITTVYILSAIAVFILLIACINFMNLSTALAAKRAKEVGIRKVVGVSKGVLILQFICESILFTLIALALAALAVQLVLPALNSFTGKELTVEYFQKVYTIPLLLAFAIGVGVLAGIYPAFYLSSFNPVAIMKGNALAKDHSAGLNISLRQILVVAQFAISITLIICTGIMYKQLQYISNKNLGFNKEHVVVLSYSRELTPQYEAFKSELTRNTAVRQVARSSRIPSGRLLDSNHAKVQKEDSLAPVASSIKYLTVDHDFIDAYQMELLAGRNFSKAYGWRILLTA